MELICGHNLKTSVPYRISCEMACTAFRAGALALFLATGILSGCSNAPTGKVALNQTDGMVIHPPEFLQGRAIVQTNLRPRVTFPLLPSLSVTSLLMKPWKSPPISTTPHQLRLFRYHS
ncbi:MAG: hypothetical protein ACI9US_001510 [Gammaproteobacteria bacterium]|jgi:hypothetical protein